MLSSCVALAAAAATAATAVATAEAEAAAEAAEECEAAAVAAEAAEAADEVPGEEAAQAIEEDEGDRGHSNAPSVERAGEESAPIAHWGLGTLYVPSTPKLAIMVVLHTSYDKYIFTKSRLAQAGRTLAGITCQRSAWPLVAPSASPDNRHHMHRSKA